MFENIINFINVAGIVTNSFVIAFTSKWSEEILVTTQNKLICVVVFEVNLCSGFFLVYNFKFI
jgi:hypothetical protein